MEPGHPVLSTRHGVDGGKRREDVEGGVHGLAVDGKVLRQFARRGRVGRDAAQRAADRGGDRCCIVEEEGVERARTAQRQRRVARGGCFGQRVEVEQPVGLVAGDITRRGARASVPDGW